MIICFCEDLWVINSVLTNKNIFDTNSIVYRGEGMKGKEWGGMQNKTTKRKNSKFYGKKIIGYNNYGVKIYLTY